MHIYYILKNNEDRKAKYPAFNFERRKRSRFKRINSKNKYKNLLVITAKEVLIKVPNPDK
jgi:hypothetical protein